METNSTKTELKTNILKRIEEEKIVPRSRLAFNCYAILIWTFWALSILVGAVAIAVSFFTVTYQKYAFYEATHENFASFIIGALPYLWFVVLSLMVVLSIYNLRHTSKGYRYPLWQVVLSSIVLSFVGGFALHYADMGFMADKKLGQYLAVYQSQEKIEEKTWQNPPEGRIIGILVPSYGKDLPANHVLIKDVRGELWSVNVADLYDDDFIILNSGKKMKVLGQMLSIVPAEFHACGILPWMLEKNISIKELSEERLAIIDRIYQHKDRQIEKVLLSTSGTGGPVVEDYCGELKAVHRIHMTP